MADDFDAAGWMRNTDIQNSLRTCEELFNSGILVNDQAPMSIITAVYTLLLIYTSDLLMKAKNDGHRVDFKDDVIITKKIYDVTELIRIARTAACHVSSPEHELISDSKFTFCIFYGRYPQTVKIGNLIMSCDYQDDVAIYFGNTRVYVKRHLRRCFDIIKAIYPDPRMSR